MVKNILSLLLLTIGFSGFSQTTTTGSFMFDGTMRSYRVYVPEIYDASLPTPLVFNLHGYGSNNIEQEAYGDFRPVADTANFIIVHPQGKTDFFGSNHWNTFGTSTIDDVGFISALIDTIYANYNIDGNRIYSTGMSNGGFMSYKLACLLSGRIAAIASVTGTMTTDEFDDCITNHPMPVMHIHGTDDATVGYEPNDMFMGVEEIVEFFVEFNECNPVPTITEVPDINMTDGCTATHLVYDGGLLGSTVEFFRINGGAHTWPGSAFGGSGTNQDINASVEIWRFFSQYTLTQLTSSVPEVAPNLLLEIYPNPANTDLVQMTFSNEQEKTITVHNFMGQVISEVTVATSTHELALNEKGIYLVSITQDGQTVTKKVVRQ